MKHKLLLSLLALFCLTGSNVWAQTTFVQDNLKYTVQGSYVSVRGNFPSTTIGEIVIPSTVTYGNMTYKVTEIEAGAFHNFNGITAMTIPASVETVRRGFLTGCSGLKNFTIKDSDTPLYFDNGYWTYTAGNEQLCVADLDYFYMGRDITMDSPDKNVVTSAKKIVVGGKMTNIPNHFSDSNAALTEVTIGGNITKIGQEAFDINTSLSKVTITAAVDTIYQSAFWGCSSLTAIELPATVKYLGPAVFRNCTALEAFTIPAATEQVDRGLLTGCTSLKSFTIEASETPLYFDNGYWTYTAGNEQLCVAELDYYYQGRDVNLNSPDCQIVTAAKSIELGGNMTAIPAKFTLSDTLLTTLIIGDNITKIGASAFSGNRSLTGVTITAPVDTIYDNAFNGCTALPAFELPATTKYIAAAAFKNCSVLGAINIPAATEQVDRGIFTGCSGLKAFTIEDSDTPLYFDNGYWTDSSGNDELCVADLDYYYQGRDVNRNSPDCQIVTAAKKIEVAGTTTVIPAYFTESNTALTEVSVHGDMTKIGNQAFNGCENLTSITFDAPIDTIYSNAFLNCATLPAIELPATTKYIAAAAFKNCAALEAITIPAATEQVDRGIFTGCSGLKTFTIADSDTPLYFNNEYWTDSGGTSELCVADLDELYIGRDVNMYSTNHLVSKAKKLTFGQPVTAIGTLCNYIADLEKVVTPWQTPIEINDNAFAEVTYSDAILLVPGGKRQAYASAQGWRKFKNIQTWSILVKMTASAHGSIATKYGTASGNTIQFNQPKDEPIVYTLSADNGYKLSALTDNGTAVSPLPQLGVAQSRTISSTEESVTLSATFAPIDYAITYDLKGGTLPSGVTNRTSYNIETATFTLNNPTREHYDFAGWTGTGLNAPTKTVTIAKGSTGDRAYTATWTPATYTVTISGAGVTASNYSPKYGESVVITIADDPDRTLVSLTVNGTDVTAQVVNGKYTITNVSSNIEVVATFRSTKEFITMTEEYAVFSCPQDLDFSYNDLCAYIVSGVNKNTHQVLMTRVFDVPAGTGLYLIGTPGQTYKVPYSESYSIYKNFLVANLTKGTVSATTGSYTNYAFGTEGGEPGFYPINGSTTLQAQTAYLQLPTSFVEAGVKMSIILEEDLIDGIEDFYMDNDADAAIYDLAGRRLQKMQKGINIVNGKKVLK